MSITPNLEVHIGELTNLRSMGRSPLYNFNSRSLDCNVSSIFTKRVLGGLSNKAVMLRFDVG